MFVVVPFIIYKYKRIYTVHTHRTPSHLSPSDKLYCAKGQLECLLQLHPRSPHSKSRIVPGGDPKRPGQISYTLFRIHRVAQNTNGFPKIVRESCQFSIPKLPADRPTELAKNKMQRNYISLCCTRMYSYHTCNVINIHV